MEVSGSYESPITQEAMVTDVPQEAVLAAAATAEAPEADIAEARAGAAAADKEAKRAQSQFSDVSKFVNKAVITEEVPHFKPEHSFLDFKIEEKLKANILKKRVRRPDSDQDRAIPHVLVGQDVVGIANTGTGKTAAFLIPLIDKVMKDRKQKILIMVPTRELATQIDDELKAFAMMLSVFSVCCVGGAHTIGRQISNLGRMNNFVIGTPGRLKDLVERRALNLAEVQNSRPRWKQTACSTWVSSMT